MEKEPGYLAETQFLQDIRGVAGKISDVIENRAKSESGPEGVTIELLRLALSLESAFAVWCLRHVQLERVNPNPPTKASLAQRLEAAIEDANSIAERLHQLTGTMELQVDWLPSANTPVASDNWSFRNALLEGMTAEIITLECYRGAINYVKTHDAPTAGILEEIVNARQGRLGSEVDEALRP